MLAPDTDITYEVRDKVAREVQEVGVTVQGEVVRNGAFVQGNWRDDTPVTGVVVRVTAPTQACHTGKRHCASCTITMMFPSGSHVHASCP